MVPVFLAAAPMVPHAVLAEEKEILRSEGYFHVSGLYYRNAADADKMRRLEAERRVDQARVDERRAAERSAGVVCGWCEKVIPIGVPTVIIAFRWVHAEPCADEYDAFTAGSSTTSPAPDPAAAAGPGGEHDPRWSLVTDATLVEFEGEMTTWGDLMLADRKTVEMLPDGRLVGGYDL
jgi:hypothetical protein